MDAWEKLAELCGQYLRKGRSVLVEGRLQMDTWEKDGQKHQKLKIRAMTVKFMPLPAPNQSRLTGEPIVPGQFQPQQPAQMPPVMPQPGDMDGFDEDQPF